MTLIFEKGTLKLNSHCCYVLLSVFLSSPLAQVYGLFSTECARYKDFIHLHSFMHDFYLSMVLGMLRREREIPDWLDLKRFLGHFIQENKLLPTFIRNRLERGWCSHQ